MKSISMKKLLVFLVVALLVVAMSSTCMAIGSVNMGDMYEGADAGAAGEGIESVTSMILGIVQVVGVAVAVVILVVLAIKYISAAPNEKADIKKSAIVYVIGVVLLFAGVAVLNIIQNAGNELATQVGIVSYENRA